ncbi:MAG: hypothetical protein AB7I13_19815, partial [Vicinamibacterales bacterium]
MARWNHCIRALAFAWMVWLPLTAVAQPEAPASTRPSRLLILLRSVQIGAEETSVTRTPQGWTIASNGRIGPPLEITTRRLEVKYDAQ